MFFTLKSVITGVFESIYLILMEFLTWIIYVGSNFFFLGIPASLVMDFLLDKVHLNKPLKIITGMIVYSITGAFLLLVFIVVLDYRDILYKGLQFQLVWPEMLIYGAPAGLLFFTLFNWLWTDFSSRPT